VIGINVISFLRRFTKVKEDAAIGFVLSVFFGLGMVLSHLIQQRNLGQGGSSSGLDSYILGDVAGMNLNEVLPIAILGAFGLVCVLLLYPEFKLLAFDPEFALVQGWPVFLLDLALMGLLALTVVLGLSTVGVVMIAALLVLPACAARFWTDRLSVMLVLAGFLGWLMGITGTVITSVVRYPTGPVIILVGTIIFLVSAVAAPRRGILARWLAQQNFNRNLRQRLFLRRLHDQIGSQERILSLAEMVQAVGWTLTEVERLADDWCRQGALIRAVGGYQFTKSGRARGAELSRDQARWTAFLLEFPDQAANLVDLGAERIEDVVPPDLLRRLPRSP
jgi:manganese/zinc/iron transport system permease protein